ncbi:hypothetical protein OHT52_21255 [Streptomyces sp. NBC_00247]|uniref:hypothetical protein n=1 Tax=Streptomyces sp. NBC_00247 TaxID=2975689 RepID=UPI002E2DE7D3|nr:hypothetical protein [Streptomyces sp. NBC_00247]
MEIRADIAALLRDGLSDAAITRRLHVCNRTAAAHRRALGIAPRTRGRDAAPDLAALFWARTRQVDGGHLEWTGYASYTNTPSVRWKGTVYTAYRVAFRIQHGRDPIGHVRPGCEYLRCVAPAHVEDRPMRERLRAQIDSIFLMKGRAS